MKRHRRCPIDSDSDSDIETVVRCISCTKYYPSPNNVSDCKKCYDGFDVAEEELMQEINDLKAKADFLSLSSSLDHDSNSRTFTDVVLIAISEDGAPSPPIYADKSVLVSRSPVFKAMLENEMEETRSSTIKIRDISFGALETFVNYLYRAEECLDEQMACELLVISEKYQVIHLKSHCEKLLVTKLSPEKSLVAYAFANQHNAKHLLDAALSTIIQNLKTIILSEEYMELMKKDPGIIVKIYEAYFLKHVASSSTSKTG